MVGESGKFVCSGSRAVGPALGTVARLAEQRFHTPKGAGSIPAGATHKALRVVRSPSTTSPIQRSDSRAHILGCGGIGRRRVYPYLQDETRFPYDARNTAPDSFNRWWQSSDARSSCRRKLANSSPLFCVDVSIPQEPLDSAVITYLQAFQRGRLGGVTFILSGLRRRTYNRGYVLGGVS